MVSGRCLRARDRCRGGFAGRVQAGFVKDSTNYILGFSATPPSSTNFDRTKVNLGLYLHSGGTLRPSWMISTTPWTYTLTTGVYDLRITLHRGRQAVGFDLQRVASYADPLSTFSAPDWSGEYQAAVGDTYYVQINPYRARRRCTTYGSERLAADLLFNRSMTCSYGSTSISERHLLSRRTRRAMRLCASILDERPALHGVRRRNLLLDDYAGRVCGGVPSRRVRYGRRRGRQRNGECDRAADAAYHARLLCDHGLRYGWHYHMAREGGGMGYGREWIPQRHDAGRLVFGVVSGTSFATTPKRSVIARFLLSRATNVKIGFTFTPPRANDFDSRKIDCGVYIDSTGSIYPTGPGDNPDVWKTGLHEGVYDLRIASINRRRPSSDRSCGCLVSTTTSPISRRSLVYDIEETRTMSNSWVPGFRSIRIIMRREYTTSSALP